MSKKSALTDVKTLRRRPRQDLEDGAVTLCSARRYSRDSSSRLMNYASFCAFGSCSCLRVPVLLPLDCKRAIFTVYIQWLIFLLIGNTMKNTMLRNFFKKFHFFHKSVSTQCLIRTLFQEDIQVDDVSQVCV